MSRNLSSTAKQAINSQETEEVFIALLTVSYAGWTDDVRVSSDSTELLPTAGVRGTISSDLEYVYAPFSVNLPAQDDTSVARAMISVDNVSRDLMEKIRSATSAVGISMKIVLASDPDVVEMSMTDFKMEKVTYDAFTISGEISVQYFDLEPFPAQRIGPSNFPAVF